jgi:hypothetical protein
VRHNSKVKQGQLSKDGYWELKPQGQTKTIKNELNPVFEESFVVTSSAAILNQSEEAIQRQEVELLVTVHDWNRTSADVLLGLCRIKLTAGESKPNATIPLVDELGKAVNMTGEHSASVTLSLTYHCNPAQLAPAVMTRELEPVVDFAQMKLLEKERDLLQSLSRDLSGDLAASREQLAASREQLAALQAQKDQECADLQDALAVCEADFKELHMQMQALLNKNQEGEQERILLQEQLAEEQKIAQRAREAQQALLNRNQEGEQERILLQEQLAEEQKIAQRAREAQQRLENDMRNQQQALQRDASLATKDKEISDLRQQLDQQDALRAQIRDMEKELALEQDTITQLRAESAADHKREHEQQQQRDGTNSPKSTIQ